MEKLTEPTPKLARILAPLQARLIEEESRIAVANVDGHKVPFYIHITTTSAPLLFLSFRTHHLISFYLRGLVGKGDNTGIVIIIDHAHAPGELGAEVELLVSAVQVACCGDIDGLECGVIHAGAGVIAADVEAVLVGVAVAFDLCLEVVAAWGGDGSVGSCVGWIGWRGEGESRWEGEEGGEGWESELHVAGVEVVMLVKMGNGWRAIEWNCVSTESMFLSWRCVDKKKKEQEQERTLYTDQALAASPSTTTYA